MATSDNRSVFDVVPGGVGLLSIVLDVMLVLPGEISAFETAKVVVVDSLTAAVGKNELTVVMLVSTGCVSDIVLAIPVISDVAAAGVETAVTFSVGGRLVVNVSMAMAAAIAKISNGRKPGNKM